MGVRVDIGNHRIDNFKVQEEINAMSQQQTIGRTATSVSGDGEGNTEITYHSTRVVIFNPDLIILDSGGWFSNTTKARMNQASNTFKLGFSVYQSKHQWYVSFGGKTYPYSDKMRLDRKSGKVYGNTFLNRIGKEIQSLAEQP